MSERYKSAMHTIEEAKDWPLRTFLVICPVKEWLGKIVEIFKACCAGRSDKAAKWYFSLAMQAIEDDLLTLYIKKVKAVEVLEGDYRDIRKARDAAGSGRAEWAKELWRGLPTTEQGHVRVQYDMDDHRLEPIEVATLLETREAILTEIAQRWRNTENEEEADRLFDFLADETASRFEEERKVVIGVFRKITDGTFPVARLTRHFLQYIGKRRPVSEIASILAIARTRNSKEVYEEVSVMRHLEGCTNEAYRAAALFTAEVAALDRKAIELKKVVQPDHERSYCTERTICGDVTLTYLALNSVAVKIVQKFDRPPLPQKPWGHDQFELARSRAASWKEANPDIGVQLSLTVQKTFSDEVVFTREQKL